MDGARQFLKTMSPISLFHKTARQLVMRIGEIRIDLDGILIFDDRFVVFALLEVRRSFVEVLLLADLRVARTSRLLARLR